jgi:hypothetical protein
MAKRELLKLMQIKEEYPLIVWTKKSGCVIDTTWEDIPPFVLRVPYYQVEVARKPGLKTR